MTSLASLSSLNSSNARDYLDDVDDDRPFPSSSSTATPSVTSKFSLPDSFADSDDRNPRGGNDGNVSYHSHHSHHSDGDDSNYSSNYGSNYLPDRSSNDPHNYHRHNSSNGGSIGGGGPYYGNPPAPYRNTSNYSESTTQTHTTADTSNTSNTTSNTSTKSSTALSNSLSQLLGNGSGNGSDPDPNIDYHNSGVESLYRVSATSSDYDGSGSVSRGSGMPYRSGVRRGGNRDDGDDNYDNQDMNDSFQASVRSNLSSRSGNSHANRGVSNNHNNNSNNNYYGDTRSITSESVRTGGSSNASSSGHRVVGNHAHDMNESYMSNNSSSNRNNYLRNTHVNMNMNMNANTKNNNNNNDTPPSSNTSIVSSTATQSQSQSQSQSGTGYDDKSVTETSIVTTDYYSNNGDAITTTTSNDNSNDNDNDDDNSENRLALQVAKEVRPMMHLLRFLRELDSDVHGSGASNADGGANGTALTRFRTKPDFNTKEANVALASLISEFEEEVEMIEHRVQNQHLLDGDGNFVGSAAAAAAASRDGRLALSNNHPNNNNNNNLDTTRRKDRESPLPPHWIELQDPDSGDVYYANEATGETTWDRPSSSPHRPTTTGEESTVYSSSTGGTGLLSGSSATGTASESMGTTTESGTTATTTTNGTEETGPLLPDWVAVEDPNSGDIYYANEVTGETTWDRPSAPRSVQKQESLDDYPNEDKSTNNLSTTSASRDNDDDDGSLPENWMALDDPDSGDTYYVNKETGESTWDRPVKQPNTESQETMNSSAHSGSTSLDDDDDNDNDNDNDATTNNDDDDDVTERTSDAPLPPGWTAIVDPSSGDTYYAHESGETTWDRPAMPPAQSRTPPSSLPGSMHSIDDDDGDNGDDKNENDNNDDDDLPPGWIAVVDPDSGDTYYVNEATSETTWDRPSTPSKHAPQSSLNASQRSMNSSGHGTNASGDDNDENLPPGWLAVLDPDSGDHYYVNEATGDTTWDHPGMPAGQNKTPSVFDASMASSYFTAGDDDDDGSLPPGWLAVDDPASGDTYYVNEATGETTWDRPPSSGNQASSRSFGMSQPSIHTTDDDDADLPPGWMSVDDPDTGDTYYVNEETGESTWDKPSSGNDGNSPSQDEYTVDQTTTTGGDGDEDLLPNWFSVVDQTSGDVYYANEVTGETSWDRPVDPNRGGGGGSNEGGVDDEDNDGLPSGWFAVADPASGDTYYVNEVTGETTWDRPVGGGGEKGLVNGISRLNMGEDGAETSSVNF